jgi:tetratricopeptide (TPR) repeat protein
MRYVRLAWFAVALLPAGCRLPGWEGPVSRSLADCRRLSQQGMVALDRGEQEKAESLLSQAVNACPVDAEARCRYAEALWRRGARKEALAQLEAAGRVTPDDATLWTRMAEMQLAVGQVATAGQTAQRALELDSKLPGAWAVWAGARHAAGKPQEALAAYLRALGYAPNDRAMLREVAELYRELNRPERALQTLQLLAETYPPDEEPADCLYLTGLAYVALARYDDAVESFSAAVTRGTPTAEMYCQLGQAELLAGHAAEAACAAQQALTLDATHRPSRELLDRIELAQRAPRVPCPIPLKEGLSATACWQGQVRTAMSRLQRSASGVGLRFRRTLLSWHDDPHLAAFYCFSAPHA